MAAKLIDGRKVADQIYADLESDITALKRKGVIPKLTVVLVGDDPASAVYVRMKAKACEKLGLISETLTFPASMTQKEILQLIDQLNANSSVHGILVQMPLPDQMDANEVIERISPEKDVDGFHPVNKGRLQSGLDAFLPCTPFGVQKMLEYSGISTVGKNVVIVGRSQIVGMPLALLLAQKRNNADATVTICHSRTKNIDFFTKNADIVIAAIGKPEFITASMVAENSIVIDVGVNRVEDPRSERGYKLVGDVKFDEVSEKVQAITPVPGGVGPMTIAMLMYNTVKAAQE
ncbi:bifunctional methylenetetrahydrofolate dehydrogenase/methenyltetrahydrofolate cyclohydrolase FolD [candidate division KSB1 bacterium]|nr:bifunctional methylenetetrahydrofolate dehydrogenase/methenyltetrahydrofolate cyclohydrolase FolD [candidate division KSB1 bacterium]